MVNPFIIRTQYNYFSVVTYIILCFSIGVTITNFLYYFKISERHSEAITETTAYVMGVLNVLLFIILLVKFGLVSYKVFNESKILKDNFDQHMNTKDHTVFRFHLDSNTSYYGFFIWFVLLATIVILSLNIYFFNEVSLRPNQDTMSNTDATNVIIVNSILLLFVFSNFVWNTAIMYSAYKNEKTHDENKLVHLPYQQQKKQEIERKNNDKQNVLDKILENANK